MKKAIELIEKVNKCANTEGWYHGTPATSEHAQLYFNLHTIYKLTQKFLEQPEPCKTCGGSGIDTIRAATMLAMNPTEIATKENCPCPDCQPKAEAGKEAYDYAVNPKTRIENNAVIFLRELKAGCSIQVGTCLMKTAPDFERRIDEALDSLEAEPKSCADCKNEYKIRPCLFGSCDELPPQECLNFSHYQPKDQKADSTDSPQAGETEKLVKENPYENKL